MAPPYPLRVEALAAKVQSALGTDSVPTAAENAVRGIRGFWTALSDEYVWDNMRDDIVSGTLIEEIPGVPHGHMINFGFTVELKGAGAAYSATVLPEVDPLLVACGLLRTVDDTLGTETVEYTLADDGHELTSIYVWAGGQVHKLVDCRGTMRWDAPAGTQARATFQMQGRVTEVSAEATPAATYDATEAPAIVNAGFGITPNGGSLWTPNFSQFSLDLDNNIVRLDDGNAADGIEQFAVPAREPRLILSARSPALSTYNPYALREANTLQALTSTIGATQYNRIDVESTDMRLVGRPGKQDDNEFAAYELMFMLRDLTLRFD